MIEIVLLGIGWIVGLSGVAAAATATFLGTPLRRRHRRWALLWLVLLPACELRCEGPRRRDPTPPGPPPGMSPFDGDTERAEIAAFSIPERDKSLVQ